MRECSFTIILNALNMMTLAPVEVLLVLTLELALTAPELASHLTAVVKVIRKVTDLRR